MRGRWLRRALQLALVGLVVGAGGLWWLASQLIAPAPAAIGAAPVDLDAREVRFAGDGGEQVAGWFAPGVAGQGAVLLLHGVRANRLAMLERARFLHAAGYAVLLIDFRAHGASDGDAVTFGWRESRDAAAALTQLRRLAPGERVGVIGTSMGGAASLLADPPLAVDALVLEQVYPTIAQALADRLRLHLGALGSLAAGPLTWTVEARLHLAADWLRPIDRIALQSAPKLLIAGDRDVHTQLRESQALFDAAAAPKEFWIVPGAQHVDLYHYSGDAYRTRVLAFLAHWLRP